MSTSGPELGLDRSHARGSLRLAGFVATAGGAGLIPRAPGTAGALVGVFLYLAITLLGAQAVSPLILAVTTIAGIWAASRVEPVYGHDSPKIVIDEVAGQMLTLAFAVRSDAREVLAGAFLGFLLFRFFDILKPFPIRRLERLPGGFGVVADDLGAGFYALVVLILVEPWAVEVMANF